MSRSHLFLEELEKSKKVTKIAFLWQTPLHKMRINFVSFLDPRTYHGGGEMISRRLVEIGQSRGHEIRISSVRPKHRSLHARPHLSLLVDVFNFGHSLKSFGAWRGFGKDFLKQVTQGAPFVHLSNAYVDVCNLPYLPCSGKRGDCCPEKPELSFLKRLIIKDRGNNCFTDREEVRSLFEKSALNVYLSPLHQKTTESLFLNCKVTNGYVIKPMIDTERFKNEKLERDIDYLFVGVIGEAKGLSEMRERFKDKNIVLIGRIAPGKKVDFGTHLGHVSYQEIPKYMNRAKHFVFYPRWPEPQGRVVAEAALCGCKILANENVGALSFNMDLADPKNYEGVENAFWEKLEGLAA